MDDTETTRWVLGLISQRAECIIGDQGHSIELRHYALRHVQALRREVLAGNNSRHR